jgi:hypothetical protein
MRTINQFINYIPVTFSIFTVYLQPPPTQSNFSIFFLGKNGTFKLSKLPSIPPIFASYLPAFSKTTSTKVNRSGKRRHHCLIPDI